LFLSPFSAALRVFLHFTLYGSSSSPLSDVVIFPVAAHFSCDIDHFPPIVSILSLRTKVEILGQLFSSLRSSLDTVSFFAPFFLYLLPGLSFSLRAPSFLPWALVLPTFVSFVTRVFASRRSIACSPAVREGFSFVRPS